MPDTVDTTINTEQSTEAHLPLGQILLAQKSISEADLAKALEVQAEIGGRIGAIFVRIGAVSEDVILDALSSQLKIEILGGQTSTPSAAEILASCNSQNINIDWLLDQQAIAWTDRDATIMNYAAKDPLADSLVSALELLCREQTLNPFLIKPQDFDAITAELAKLDRQNFRNTDSGYLKELAEEAPIVELVKSVFAQAIDNDASDIHLEPEESSFKIRFRIDGVLTTRMTLSRDKFDAVASRIKLIANIDIAERRLPQDGSISTRASGMDLDVRVSTLPGVFGESIVMRLLPKDRTRLNLAHLGLFEDHLKQMQRWVREPHGIVLVTGPTGSGKSTTLYTALDETNENDKKIITVEDPVEFKLKGITQIQANADIGLTFASALRSILRQDPDVIMIGEIRDLETAEIAIQSALTGHLVLSTLHTNDSLSAFTRLIDMGVEPFLVATPIIATQAQRLVRRLCVHCSEPAIRPLGIGDEIANLSQHLNLGIQENWRQAKGCPKCQLTGYKGRVGIYEMVDVTPELQAMILERTPVEGMYQLAKSQGFRNLQEDGLLKAMQGLTTVEEVLRITRSRAGIDQ
jgi:general secretion pathway protein E